ncbi:BamA/TamA family outer membrane protein, partial [Acidobacteria bacterium AH-259-O06]|nr:BamA/TamA family outer membrane protein [Acidobacteria bacterium AH-259-O06]
ANNFRGKGQRIDVQVLTGTRTSQFRFAFTEPYFRDTPLTLGLSVFRQRLRFDTFTSFFGLGLGRDNLELFTQSSTGFTVSGSYPLWRWTRVGLTYSYQNISISDVDERFRGFAFNQLLGFTPGGGFDQARKGLRRSEITPSLVYNTKNQFFGATQGSQLSLQVPISGGPLGGTFNIIRPTVEYQYFMPDRFLSGGRHTLAFRVQFMHVFPFGQLETGDPMTVPFFERVFSGGEFTLRGFDLRSVSPLAITRTAQLDPAGNAIIDPATGLPAISENVIPVGGDTSIVGTVEYRIPLVGPLQVTPFLDFGTSTVLKKGGLRLFGRNTLVDVVDSTNNVYRASTGAEIQFLMPMINQPFRLIFAYNPLILDSSVVLNGIRFPLREPRKNIKFSVGYSF